LTAQSGSAARTFYTVAIIAILALAAYLAIEVSSLQGQVSSLQDQNYYLQGQIADLEGQQANLGNQLAHLLSTTTQTSGPSFELVSVCLSVAPQCHSYPGHPGSYVYAIALRDNGTTAFSQSTPVYLHFNDTTRLTQFGFNTTLPQELQRGGMIYLNATSWPQYTNATSKLAPGDQVGLAVFLGTLEAGMTTHVITCTTTTTTFLNYTLTQTATNTGCS
jgi:hypothetical protein